MSSSIRFIRFVAIVTSILFTVANCQSSTDTLTWGGSDGRAGYEDSHNMDPSIVESSSFGQLWKTELPGMYGQIREQIYAQPLIYTENDGIQYVFIATQQNNVYKLNAKTGAIVASRNLGRVFLTADLEQCNDIMPVIGSTATGVIDASTGTWYLTSKTYSNQDKSGPVGRPNGRYKVFALQTKDLSDRVNFPVDLEYTPSRNSPDRWFTGGIHHQRPALLMHNDFVYAGFASHCIQYNYTGWIIGWHKGSGRVVESWTTIGEGYDNQVSGAGIWMSGGGIASAGESMYFSTGNDAAGELRGGNTAGLQNIPKVMGEAVVNARIQPDGKILLSDFFMPSDKQNLDNADRDLGTTPFQLLPSQFSCGNVKRIGMVTGKTGKTYWLNVDDLGGFRQGNAGDDRIIQSYQHENSVYAGAGVYPGNGGYVYINVIGYPTKAFKFSCQNGRPYFNPVAQTSESNSGYLGLGHGSTTSLNGQDGTGLLWITDPQGENLRIYKAIPEDNTLVKIKTYSGTGASKFGKLAFGDGIVYHGNMDGTVYAYGAPVNQPIECNDLSFETIDLNKTSAPLTVRCRAKITTSITSISSRNQTDFTIQNLPTLPLTVQAGTNLSFAVTFTPRTVGVRASAIVLQSTQQGNDYTPETRVQVRGVGRSATGLLKISPPTLDWNGVITGADQNGVNQSFVLSNVGNTPVTISTIRYSTESSTGPWLTQTNSSGVLKFSAFTFFDIPSKIDINNATVIPVNFKPPSSGSYQIFLRFESSGGVVILKAAASGSDQPKAFIEFGTLNGTWQSFIPNGTFNFGTILGGTSKEMILRVTNTGGSKAAPLVVTVSKPPLRGRDSYIGANSIYDLGEGTHIAAGQNASASITCNPPTQQYNSVNSTQTTTWTMNYNSDFGHQVISFSCSASANQSGPLDKDGQAFYKYAGCFKDNTPGRQLQNQIASTSDMTNGACIDLCSKAGYIFAGTQYQQECWCGNNRAKFVTDESHCNYRCSGDGNQVCGGSVDGSPRMSLFGDVRRWDGNINSTDVGPYINPGSLGFKSLGCWSYNPGDTRPVSIPAASNDTVTSCLSACQKDKFTYAGLEYGGECYCGTTLDVKAVSVDSSSCSMACNNNQTEICGSAGLQNVYFNDPYKPTSTSISISSSTTITSTSTSTLTLSSVSTTTSSSITTISAFSTNTPAKTSTTSSSVSTTTSAQSELDPYIPLGCYSDSTGDRTFTDGYLADGNAMTPLMCKKFCAQRSSIYFGIEYGLECFCGQSMSPVSQLRPDGECDMSCNGNQTQKCGGNLRLNVYQIRSTTTATSTSTAMGQTTTSSPSLSTTTTLARTTISTSESKPSSGATSSTTITSSLISSTSSTLLSSPKSEISTTQTTSSAYIKSSTNPGTTASTQIVSPGSSVSTSVNIKTFSSVSTTSPTPVVSSSSKVSTVSTTTTTTTTTTATTQIPKSTDPSFVYIGCANDSAGSRGLNSATYSAEDMTPSKCQAFCSSRNLPLAAVEFSRECFCGITLASSSKFDSPNSACDRSCAGDPAQLCGGAGWMNVYKNTNYTPTGVKQKIRSYAYQGCFVDQGDRTVIGTSFQDSKMTEEMCVEKCFASGSTYSGVENGNECWCGNTLSKSAARAAEGDCATICAGDAAEFCGGSWRLNLWQTV